MITLTKETTKEREPLKTLSYVLATDEEITVGKNYYFGELWDGNGDGEKLLEDRCISPDNEAIVNYDIVEKNIQDILASIVRVTDIR